MANDKPLPPATKEALKAARIRKLVDVSKFLNQRIQDFRHAQHIDTENAAIRRLIVAGLRAERETAAVTSQADRDAELRQILIDNKGGFCSDIRLLRAIAETPNYMVAGIFIPIDPETAEDRIIDGEPLFVMRVESQGDAKEIETRDTMYRMSLALSKSIGECFEASVDVAAKQYLPGLKVVQ